jgi:hypothetical protein
MCALSVYLKMRIAVYSSPIYFVGAARSGLGLTRKFATVVLDWLENLARAAGGVLDWLENLAWAAGGVWTGSKIWHGLLVAS